MKQENRESRSEGSGENASQKDTAVMLRSVAERGDEDIWTVML